MSIAPRLDLGSHGMGRLPKPDPRDSDYFLATDYEACREVVIPRVVKNWNSFVTLNQFGFPIDAGITPSSPQ